ncbi:hypothetical protein [Streptomyces sp. NPDC001315]|uniref:hypothetical protein n=1 Tax=Streptomyces sp. NPDC001315 TaxID=3364562 RepID=UPI00369A15B5
MTQDRYEPLDTAAATVSLAAEAAVLEARVHMLRETIDTVDARIQETSEKLRRLRLSLSSPTADKGAETDAPAGVDGVASDEAGPCREWSERSVPCRL